MVWRCFGRGFAATVIGYGIALIIDQQLWPLGSRNGPFLAFLFIIAAAWWGAARSTSARQGALCGALTILAPAAFWTFLYCAIQIEWGGRQAANIWMVYTALLLTVPPLVLGSIVGAVVGHLNAKKLPLL
ncbi:MAG TPA: hypothetical protein VNT01_10010 [Symbiobacteriaceae bacterium]|nr:hypothetical protein [Symbiobacteriaceae bacterium]